MYKKPIVFLSSSLLSLPSSLKTGAGNRWSWIVYCSLILHTLHLPLVVQENLIPYILLDSRWQNHLPNKKGTWTYLSWVSLIVSSFKRNRSFNSPTEKCLSTSSSSSTTQLLSAFLWACRWKIFSSIVPVYKEKKCRQHECGSEGNGCLVSVITIPHRPQAIRTPHEIYTTYFSPLLIRGKH